MRFARVIGRVTLNVADPAYKGGRFMLGIPCGPETPAPARGGPLPKGNSFVIYDNLGASEGDLVAYTDGGEAAAPFADPTPCDAYNAAILDGVFWDPPSNQ
jgi:microcompartment protein CcmK/EutM